jgi:hypothetical protein
LGLRENKQRDSFAVGDFCILDARLAQFLFRKMWGEQVSAVAARGRKDVGDEWGWDLGCTHVLHHSPMFMHLRQLN